MYSLAVTGLRALNNNLVHIGDRGQVKCHHIEGEFCEIDINAGNTINSQQVIKLKHFKMRENVISLLICLSTCLNIPLYHFQFFSLSL